MYWFPQGPLKVPCRFRTLGLLGDLQGISPRRRVLAEYIKMPKKDNKILKYNLGENSIKVPFIVYADLASLLNKINTCHDNILVYND